MWGILICCSLMLWLLKVDPLECKDNNLFKPNVMKTDIRPSREWGLLICCSIMLRTLTVDPLDCEKY